MAWKMFTPDDMDDLFLVLRRAANYDAFCRGHSNIAWRQLTPTIVRAIESSQAEGERPFHAGRLLMEIGAVILFSQQARMHLSQAESTLLDSFSGTMILMQHYGAATRLVDWTLSPWVAAYFAASEDLDKDGLIWVVDRSTLVKKATETGQGQFKAMLRAKDHNEWFEAAQQETDAVCQVIPTVNNPKITAQQSVMTMGGSLCHPQDIAIERMVPDANRFQVVIRSALKSDLMVQLNHMNINAYSLFSGASGVGQQITQRLLHGIPLGVSQRMRQRVLELMQQATGETPTHPPDEEESH